MRTDIYVFKVMTCKVIYDFKKYMEKGQFFNVAPFTGFGPN